VGLKSPGRPISPSRSVVADTSPSRSAKLFLSIYLLRMQYFYSAFSSKRMSTASSSSTASAASRECSKSVVTSDLRVSWCRLEDRLPETSSDEEKQHRSIINRISELCNTTLLALEKMQTGHLKKWGERCFWVKDSVSVDHLNRRPGSFSETLAPRCADLLERLSNFWVDF
jgi:hypothetical protein